MRIKDLIAHLETYHPDDPVAASIWLGPDVEARAADLGCCLTEDQIADVLADIHYNFDANYGIRWDTFDDYIRQTRLDRCVRRRTAPR